MNDSHPTCSSIEDAVVTLEKLDLGELADDPSAMAEAMILRQYALEFLKSHPLSAVLEPGRSALRQRLTDVLARDAETMKVLREARVQVGEQLDSLVSGRAAVRGYGGLSTGGATSQAGVKRMG